MGPDAPATQGGTGLVRVDVDDGRGPDWLHRSMVVGAALDQTTHATEDGLRCADPGDRPEPTRAARSDRPDGVATRFTERVLHAFLVDGRLTTIPARERKRQVILRYLAENDFEEGRDYPEREVDQRLALRQRDVAALRRYLVDSRYLERDGGHLSSSADGRLAADPDAWSAGQPRGEASPDE